MAQAPAAALPTPSAVAAHVEALDLTGLAFAVRRLLGKDPLPVTSQLGMWAGSDRPGPPPLTQPLWAALAPLGGGRPQMPAAHVCDALLRGRERDGTTALKAAADCAEAGKARFRPLPPGPEGEDPGDARRRAALAAAVKGYWRLLGTLYGELRAPISAGDLAAAAALVDQAKPGLRALVGEVRDLAAAVAGQALQDPEGAAAATPQPAAGLPAAGAADAQTGTQRLPVGELPAEPPHAVDPVAGTPADPRAAEPHRASVAAYVEDQQTGPLPADPQRRAEAFAQGRRVVVEPEAEERPVEVLARRPPRNHPVLPAVFLLAVVGVALYVIFAVLNAPNPLAS